MAGPLFRDDGLMARKPTRDDVREAAMTDPLLYHFLRMVRVEALTFEEAMMGMVLTELRNRRPDAPPIIPLANDTRPIVVVPRKLQSNDMVTTEVEKSRRDRHYSVRYEWSEPMPIEGAG